MNGKELKEILRTHNIGIVKLANLLGYNQPRLSQMLTANDIKTGLLESICKVLGVSMDFFYANTSYALGGNEIGKNIDWKKMYEEKEKENLQMEGKCKALEAAYSMLLDKFTKANT